MVDLDRFVILSFIFSFTVFGISFAYSSSEYGIGIETQTFAVKEGNNLTVSCNISQSEDLKVFWKKGDSNVTFQQYGIKFVLHNVNRSESGEYVCYAYNQTYETEANATVVETVFVDVQYPAEVTSFFIEPKVVTENSNFTIQCTIEGNPIPIVLIQSNLTDNVLFYGHVAGTVTEVVSPPVGCEDSGYWMCKAHNSLNKEDISIQSDNITVYCRPKPKPGNRYKVYSRTKTSAYLIMNNWGNPQPNYTWYHGSGILPVHNHTHYDTGSKSILNISNVEKGDFGVYWVTMENSFGVYDSEYILSPRGMPEPPTNLTFSDVTYYSVNLKWRAGYNMGSLQQFTVYLWENNAFYPTSDVIDEDNLNPNVGHEYSDYFTNLAPDTVYNVTIGASNNDGGPAFAVRSVHFKTKQKPDSSMSKWKKHMIIAGSVIGGCVLVLTMLKLLSCFLNKASKKRADSCQDEEKESAPINKYKRFK